MQGGDPQFVTWLYASGIGPNLEDRSGLDEGDEEVLVYKGRNEETESRPVTWYDENGEKHSGWRRFCYSSDDDSATAATTIGRFLRNTGSISLTD